MQCTKLVILSSGYFSKLAHNVLQLPEVRIFETVSYRTAYNKAKYLMDICKAKIIVFRGSDRFCKCRSRITAFLVGDVSGSLFFSFVLVCRALLSVIVRWQGFEPNRKELLQQRCRYKMVTAINKE